MGIGTRFCLQDIMHILYVTEETLQIDKNARKLQEMSKKIGSILCIMVKIG